MTTKSKVESAWAEDKEKFLFYLDSGTGKITRRFEKLQFRIIERNPYSLIKLASIITCCLNIYSSTYIYIYIYIN